MIQPQAAPPAPAPPAAASAAPAPVVFDEDVTAFYNIGDQLGKGNYGTVFAATDKATGKAVALKIIPKAKAGTSREKVEKEIAIMRDLDHPRILRMHSYIPTEANYNLILEKVDGGELLAQMLKLKRYTERKACRVMFNLLSALKHMHGRQWMHCDLKPENLLLVKPPTSDEEVTSIKLADFGLSRSVRPDQLPRTTCGSPLYIAPEVIEAGMHKTRPHYNEKADLWSAGIICFLLLTGMIPFFGKTPHEIFNVVLTTNHNFNHKSWEPISAAGKDFVNRLLVKDPAARMGAAEALAHPWMRLSAGPDAQEDIDLPETREGLKTFNAQTKLKGAIYGVEAMFKLAYLSRCTLVKVKPNSQVLAKLSQLADYDADLAAAGEDGRGDQHVSPSSTAADEKNNNNSNANKKDPTRHINTRLKEVDLSGNYLGQKGLQALADTLTAASDVEVLNLTNCLLEDRDIDALIPFFIRPTCRLTTLICDSNELSHAGGRLLVELARARPQFTHISAERNRIKGSIMERLAHQCVLNRDLAAAGASSKYNGAYLCT